jgi:hypothetical protein
MTTSHPTPEPQPRDPSVDEFEAALIKARDAWQSKGTRPRSTRPTSYSVNTTRHR